MNQMPMGGGDIDPVLMDYYLEMAGLQPQENALQRQRAMIEQLRGASQMPTDTRNAGRLQVARNPLEMLAPVLGQGIASWKENKANKAEDVYGQSRRDALGKVRSRWDAMGKKPGSMFPTRPLPGEEDGLPY